MRLIDADILSEVLMEELGNRSMQGFGKGLLLANSCVIHAPTIEPDQRWTPVSEKAYPTEEGKYLVTDDAGGMATVDVDDFMYCDDGSGMWLCSQNVTAWMPLPEPYREEGNQDG